MRGKLSAHHGSRVDNSDQHSRSWPPDPNLLIKNVQKWHTEEHHLLGIINNDRMTERGTILRNMPLT